MEKMIFCNLNILHCIITLTSNFQMLTQQDFESHIDAKVLINAIKCYGIKRFVKIPITQLYIEFGEHVFNVPVIEEHYDAFGGTRVSKDTLLYRIADIVIEEKYNKITNI